MLPSRRHILRTALLVGAGWSLPVNPAEAMFNALADPSKKNYYRKSHALIVGVSKYKQKSRNLYYARADAQDICNILVQDYDFEPENVTLLLDSDATKANITTALKELSNKEHVSDEDRVLLFFAGHGQTLPLPGGGDLGFLVPHDAVLDLSSPNLNASSAACISMAEVWLSLERSPATHGFVIADCCYSGLMVNKKRLFLDPPSDTVIAMKLSEDARQVMTAGTDEETAVENSAWGHGALTSELLEVFRSEAKKTNAVFLGSQLAIKIQGAVGARTNGSQTPQYGSYEGKKGDFVFYTRKRNKVIATIKSGSKVSPPSITASPVAPHGRVRVFVRDAVSKEYLNGCAVFFDDPTGGDLRSIPYYVGDTTRFGEQSRPLGGVGFVVSDPLPAHQWYAVALIEGYESGRASVTVTEGQTVDLTLFVRRLELSGTNGNSKQDNPDLNLDPDYLYLQGITQESARYRTADGNNFRKAINLYDQALRLRGNFYDAIYHKAICHYFLKENDQAIATATRHIELRPEVMQAYVIRAQSYVKKQEYDTALADLNTVEKSRPDLVEYRLRGQIYYFRNSYKKAATDFEQYIVNRTDAQKRIDLDAIVAFLDLGNTYGKAGDNEKAVDAYSRYITAYPDPSVAWFQRGDPEYDDLPLALGKRGTAYLDIARTEKDPGSVRLTQAGEDFQKLTELKPGDPAGYIGLGNVALFHSQWSEAVKWLDKASTLAPTNDSVLAALGEAKRLQAGSGDANALRRSMQDLTQSLTINPNNILALRGRGLINGNPIIGNYTQAVADFTKLLTLLPVTDSASAETRFNRALAYCNMTPPRFDEAIADMEVIIKQTPQAPYLVVNASYLYYKAATLEKTNKAEAVAVLRRAVDYATRALQKDAKYALAHYTKGAVLARLTAISSASPMVKKSERNTAIAALNRFVELAPGDEKVAIAKAIIAQLQQSNKP